MKKRVTLEMVNRRQRRDAFADAVATSVAQWAFAICMPPARWTEGK